jgi:hypothetical protein
MRALLAAMFIFIPAYAYSYSESVHVIVDNQSNHFITVLGDNDNYCHVADVPPKTMKKMEYYAIDDDVCSHVLAERSNDGHHWQQIYNACATRYDTIVIHLYEAGSQ